LNGDNREQQEEHWRRLTPGLKGIEWKLPNWPNVFPAVIVREQDQRTLAELAHDEREHLGKFVDSWFVADRNYVEWVKQYPELARDLEESGRFISVCFQALPDGGVQAVTRIEPPVTERTVYAAACKFAEYLRNPLRDVLAGRCKRCHRYFFNRKGYEQMVYCSRKCRWDHHNVENERSREQTQRELQATALSAMRKLFKEMTQKSRRGPSSISWKLRVVSEVNKKHGTHFEPKWLTRAINDPDSKYHQQFIRVKNAIEQLLQIVKQ